MSSALRIFQIQWYGMVWYGMAWCGMAWHGMVWYGMIWYGMGPAREFMRTILFKAREPSNNNDFFT